MKKKLLDYLSTMMGKPMGIRNKTKQALKLAPKARFNK
jgi:hypothetical protein